MGHEQSVQLGVARLERSLNALAGLAGGNRELTGLSDRLRAVRERAFSDLGLSAGELDALYGELESISSRYLEIARAEGIEPGGDVPGTRDSFRIYAENAEIHFQYLAGGDRENYRGGLLAELLKTRDVPATTRRIALDIATSASEAIAVAKVHLLRAAVSLAETDERRRELLDAVAGALGGAAAAPAWRESGRAPAMDRESFTAAASFSSAAAIRRTSLPTAVAGTNAMFPNRPLPGWEDQNVAAVAGVLNDLSAAGALFLDRVPRSEKPLHVAMKIELNMGVEGPPSVSDPATTGAVIGDLLERAHRLGLRINFTCGDSCGIENAPVGRTSLDIMRETGNYHCALKAGLRFILRRDPDESRRARASELLNRFAAVESDGTFLGSPSDRRSAAADRAAIEAFAAPVVRCVDYDDEGFVPVEPALGPLGLAVWGTRQFRVARPWVEAGYRVHVTRGASTHLFAGWTGALKGLIGLHALGLRPGDQGMNQRGESALDLLAAMMHLSGYGGILARRSGIANLWELAAQRPQESGPLLQSRSRWDSLGRVQMLKAGWMHWEKSAWELESELRQDLRSGTPETEIMARMRVRTRAILEEADRRSPGFRAALWAAVAEGTHAGLLFAWRIRNLLPREMRDDRMGMRIGLLSHVPYQADLVVQGLPKIGIGGGPDAYERVREVGIVVAATDEISCDLVALRAAQVPGNPWAYNHPIYGALQFGRGPALWEEIRMSTRQADASA